MSLKSVASEVVPERIDLIGRRQGEIVRGRMRLSEDLLARLIKGSLKGPTAAVDGVRSSVDVR